jgi:hypothetical protein
MPQSRTRYQRAAMRSKYRKPKRRRGGSLGWNIAIAAVVIVGVAAIALTRGGSSSDGGSGPPRAANQAANVAGDHWHTAFQVDVCGEWLAPKALFEKPADNPNAVENVGIHTHGDNLIHTHPFVPSEQGTNATLGKYASYAGFSVSSDSIDAWTAPASAPKQRSWSNGDTCPFGTYKGKKGELSWTVDGKVQTGNPSDYHMKNGETVGIYFLPKGAARPFPPDACNALLTISDGTASILSKSSPCQSEVTTTVPGAAPTTTLVPSSP